MSRSILVIALSVLPLLSMSASGGGGGGSSPPPVDPPPVADTNLDWDEGNWDEENWQ